MKVLTPMKRYKAAIDNLRSQISEHAHEFTLNKSESKRIPWVFARNDKYETKGVECDFIMVFESLETKGFSFALTFTYMEKTPDEQTVCGSVKFGDADDQICYGEEMTIEAFKETLNRLNKKLKTLENKNYDEIVSAFSVAFLKKTFSLAEALETATAEVEQFVAQKRLELNIDAAEATFKAAQQIRIQAKQTVNQEIEATEAYQEREKLLERLARLDKMISNKKVMLYKKEDISLKERTEKAAEQDLYSKKHNLSMQLNQELMKYPKAIRSRIVNKGEVK